MRVAIVSPSAGLGGAERVLLDVVVATRLLDPGIPILVVSLEDGPMLARAREAGATTCSLEVPVVLATVGRSAAARAHDLRAIGRIAGATARVAYQLSRVLRSFQPSVIHTNGMKAHLLGALAAGANAALVWHLHDFTGERRDLLPLLRLASRRATLAVANSTAVASDARRALPGLLVRTVLNGVDLDVFRPDAVDPQVALGDPAARAHFRVGLVATYARWKGQDVFLRAAAELARSRRDVAWRFYVIGGPVYRTAGSQWSRDELEALARELDVTPLVRFVPFVDDPADAFRALDVVVHASTRPEPFGRTILEAMACGRPVVAARGGGADEIYEDGTNAIGVAAGRPEVLASALASLADTPARATAIGRAATIHAQTMGLDAFARGVRAAWLDAEARSLAGRAARSRAR
jgi:glycosyltransferase involved in cell wall biosynthesis